MNSKLLQSTSPSNHPILFRVKAVLWGLVEGASTSFVFFLGCVSCDLCLHDHGA